MRRKTYIYGAALAVGVAGAGCAAPEEVDARVEAASEGAAARVETARVEPSLERSLVARAQPDECFEQIGFSGGKPPCTADARPKINQTAIGSGVRSKDHAYFGTVANALCLGASGYFGPLAPSLSENLVCEQAAGPASVDLGLTSHGDLRSPKMYRMNAVTNEVEDITPAGDRLLRTTIGIHGAGAHDDVVLLAGPNATPEGIDGLNIWAFEGSTGRLLGSERMTQYQEMRLGVVVKDELYLGVQRAGKASGGEIVKWIGDKADPFRFMTVGVLGSEPGYLIEHQGRIVVAGRTGVTPDRAVGEMPSIYLSPMIPEGGLTSEEVEDWQKIFEMDEYDPDPVIAHATHFGPMASWRGRLFFSTYQVPMYQTLNAFSAYGRPDDWFDRFETKASAERSVAVFSMEDIGSPRQEVTLLYGEKELPVYDRGTREWQPEPNNLGQQPAFGPSGFGNPLNQAALSFTVFEDRLYMATLDTSNAGSDLLGPMTSQAPLLDLPDRVVEAFQPLVDLVFDQLAGGDIWRMDDPNAPAVAEDLSGQGNRYNSGIQVMIPFEDRDELYGGTINPFNLRTEEDEPGGWELLKFSPRK